MSLVGMRSKIRRWYNWFARAPIRFLLLGWITTVWPHHFAIFYFSSSSSPWQNLRDLRSLGKFCQFLRFLVDRYVLIAYKNRRNVTPIIHPFVCLSFFKSLSCAKFIRPIERNNADPFRKLLLQFGITSFILDAVFALKSERRDTTPITRFAGCAYDCNISTLRASEKSWVITDLRSSPGFRMYDTMLKPAGILTQHDGNQSEVENVPFLKK